jgi:hypothetical protein
MKQVCFSQKSDVKTIDLFKKTCKEKRESPFGVYTNKTHLAMMVKHYFNSLKIVKSGEDIQKKLGL